MTVASAYRELRQRASLLSRRGVAARESRTTRRFRFGPNPHPARGGEESCPPWLSSPRQRFATEGIEISGIAVLEGDDFGPPEELDRALGRGGAVVLIPCVQNSTGAALDQNRATELGELLAAREHAS